MYTPDKQLKTGFPKYDCDGWYKEVSDEEFNSLKAGGTIKLVDGIWTDIQGYDEASSNDSSSRGIYSNPGATLKDIATAVCVIGIIISWIEGILVGKLDWEFNFGVCFLIGIAGSLISYISGLGLAAFGDLVMNVNAIKRHITK